MMVPPAALRRLSSWHRQDGEGVIMRTQRRGVSNFDGRRLAQARVRRGWAPAQLASEAAVTVTVLNQYEAEERVPAPGTLSRLANALGCAVEDLCRPAAVTLRDLRQRVGASQQEIADASGRKRSAYAMLEQGRTTTLTPQEADVLAGFLGVDRHTVETAHAVSVAGQASRPAPLVLEGSLLESLADHFAMAPEELLHLAQRLTAGEGGEKR
ncbi:XRE family transcriptional regulator [Streptomyces sp. OfavH-34-F]|uniref:helix-turn-helix transcriptional regulator n=1 Tax=Streptomyces sp. OfavH-34-F TaxID=2917760 RepID=UPI001EF25162|nr:helix-turn-helix transcriptional regulator [Streptomyces sp. OfavH-34-F]MCG7524018.1 XRE family transcriptional regulator [Streptomyces sp. OfavH-34-F]